MQWICVSEKEESRMKFRFVAYKMIYDDISHLNKTEGIWEEGLELIVLSDLDISK